MAYIIRKQSKKKGEVRTLYYLVEGYREVGKPRRRTMLCMEDNPDLDSALCSIKDEIGKVKAEIARFQEMLRTGKGALKLNSHWRSTTKGFVRDAEIKLVGLEADFRRVKRLKDKYSGVRR